MACNSASAPQLASRMGFGTPPDDVSGPTGVAGYDDPSCSPGVASIASPAASDDGAANLGTGRGGDDRASDDATCGSHMDDVVAGGVDRDSGEGKVVEPASRRLDVLARLPARRRRRRRHVRVAPVDFLAAGSASPPPPAVVASSASRRVSVVLPPSSEDEAPSESVECAGCEDREPRGARVDSVADALPGDDVQLPAHEEAAAPTAVGAIMSQFANMAG